MAGLPVYEVVGRVAHKGGTWLEVKCPRRDCGLPFMVIAKEWAESWHGHGRACPYCFKAGKLPAKRAPKRGRAKSAKIAAPAKRRRSS